MCVCLEKWSLFICSFICQTHTFKIEWRVRYWYSIEIMRLRRHNHTVDFFRKVRVFSSRDDWNWWILDEMNVLSSPNRPPTHAKCEIHKVTVKRNRKLSQKRRTLILSLFTNRWTIKQCSRNWSGRIKLNWFLLLSAVKMSGRRCKMCKDSNRCRCDG